MEKQKKKRSGLSGSTVRGIRTMLHGALDRTVKERLRFETLLTGASFRKSSIRR
ncbi:hypothetical protein [Dysosmobacter sp.]|uniref:hypothetical protein n=1 Tax=Dysosmobacter sp. TaxID=2591382 RepID=UPI003FD73C8A